MNRLLAGVALATALGIGALAFIPDGYHMPSMNCEEALDDAVAAAGLRPADAMDRVARCIQSGAYSRREAASRLVEGALAAPIN